MDNSLIPRAFGPTDAKREREANARLAERQSSARNMSTSSIPAGGTLGLGGDVDVEPGGNINLSSGGGINVAEGGRIQLAGKAASRYALNNPGQPILPYDTTTVLGTKSYVDTDGRTYVAPGVYLTHPVDASTTNLEFRGYEISLGYKSADNANVNRLSMSDVAARLESLKSVPGVGPESSTSLELRPDGLDARSTSPAVRAVTASSQINLAVGNLSVPGSPGLPVGSRAGALLGWTDGGNYARYRTNNAGGHWLETSGAATATTSVGTTGDGKLTIQATNGVDIVGALTNNGAPIAGGGSVPTDNITLTDTLQAQTVKATGNLSGASATITGLTNTGSLTVGGITTLNGNVNVNGQLFGLPNAWHWEKSGTTSAPDSTVWGPGVVTADPAVSTVSGLLTMINQDTAQVNYAGVYSLSFSMRFPAGVTATNARSAASIEPMSGPMWAKGAVIQTDDQGAASIANVRLTAGQQFHFYIVQISGATRVMSYTIRATRVSA